MYFSINPGVLGSRLNAIKNYLDSKNPYILLEADTQSNKVILSLGGAVSFSSLSIDAKVSTSGTVAVDFDLLIKLVRTYPGGTIHLRKDLSNTKFMISQYQTFPKNATVSIPLVQPQLVVKPSIPKPKDSLRYASVEPVKLETVMSSIRALKSDAGQLQGLADSVKVEFKQDKLEFATMSTRGLVIADTEASIELNPGTNAQGVGHLLAPIDVLNNLPSTSDEKIVIADHGNMMVIESTEWSIVSSVYQMQFIDYSTMLSVPTSGSLTVSTKDILPVLRRSALLLDAQTSGTGSKSVVFDIVNDELTISLNSKKGDYSDHIICSPENLSGWVAFIVDDVIASVLAVSSEIVKMDWLGQAVCVSADIPGSVGIKCLIKTVQVVAHPVQATIPDVDVDIDASEEHKEEIQEVVLKKYSKEADIDKIVDDIFGGDEDGTEAESTNNENDYTASDTTSSTGSKGKDIILTSSNSSGSIRGSSQESSGETEESSSEEEEFESFNPCTEDFGTSESTEGGTDIIS